MTDAVLILLPETERQRLRCMARQAETAERSAVIDVYRASACWLGESAFLHFDI